MRKKQIRSRQKTKANINPDVKPHTNRKLKRREFLEVAAYAVGGLTLVGGLGFWTISAAQRTFREADLGKIGQGVATVVQIHDPQCGLCLALQKQTRAALQEHDTTTFEFLVADINTVAGRNLAARYGASHVTLLMFNAKGKMVHTLQGPTSDTTVENTVRNFLKKHDQ